MTQMQEELVEIPTVSLPGSFDLNRGASCGGSNVMTPDVGMLLACLRLGRTRFAASPWYSDR